MSKSGIRALASDTVVLSRHEYERLLDAAEDTEDRLALARAGEDKTDYLPAGLARRLIAGESPLRVWREHRGLTQSTLAAKAGIGKSYLSQIESGGKRGSLATFRNLADALGLDLDDIAP